MSLEFSSSDDADDPGPGLSTIVAALDDDGCRRIVSVLEEPLTVDEIADLADLPLSSTYKKLDRLADAGLVEETVGVQQGRHRKSRYVATFDRIAIGLEDDRTFRVDVSQSAPDSLDIWSDATTEF